MAKFTEYRVRKVDGQFYIAKVYRDTGRPVTWTGMDEKHRGPFESREEAIEANGGTEVRRHRRTQRTIR
jgi:hypothetical protein